MARPCHAGSDSVRDEVDAFISSLSADDDEPPVPGIVHARSRRGSRSQVEATSRRASRRAAGNPLSLTITIPTSPTMMAGGQQHPAHGTGGLPPKVGPAAVAVGSGGGASRYTTRLTTGTVAPQKKTKKIAHYGNLGAVSSDGGGSDDGDSDSDAVPSPALAALKGGHRGGAREAAQAAINTAGARKRRANMARGPAVGDAAQEAEMKKAKSVQSARDCRRRKKAFIQSLQLQVKRCGDREANSQRLIATLEKELFGLKTAVIVAPLGHHQPCPLGHPAQPYAAGASMKKPGLDVAGPHRASKSTAGAGARVNPTITKTIPLFLQRSSTYQILG